MRIIYFDICAIVLTATVFAFLVSKHYTKGRTNRLIVMLAILFFCSGMLDLLDSLFGTYIARGPENVSVQWVTTSLYYIVRNATTPAFILFLYSFMGIWHKLRTDMKQKLIIFGPMAMVLVLVIINLFNGMLFYIDKNGAYTRGRYISILYGIAVIYILYVIYILIRFIKAVRNTEFMMIFSFILMNIAAVITQRVHQELRVENLALALSLFLIATAVQRPEEIIDSAVGTLSQHAFLKDMNRAYSLERPMNAIFIKLKNYSALRSNLGIEIYTMVLKRVGNKLVKMGRIINLYSDVYYNGRGVFSVITDGYESEKTQDLGRLIVAYLKESFTLSNLEIRIISKVCYARLPEDLDNYNTMINFSTSFSRTIPDIDQLIVLSNVMDSKDYMMKNDIDDIIKRGISGNKFRMYYQPIYSVKQDKFVSAEALIRLYDNEYGFVSPAIFIPAAEASGAIHDIGDFVLEDVCKFIHTGEFVNSGLEYIEINLSVTQCIEPKLVEKIRGLISKYKVRTDQINLEITETAVDYDPVITDNNIFSLWNMGFKFSLDDYGTGYSNIKRVVSLPLDIIKFDKSFVDEMDDPKMWIAIVNTVSMLKKMDKKILVEGVEDKRTLDRFIELGCDYIQGFYFSKPLNQEDFIKFVNEHNSGKAGVK
ncbi:MAG: EAL domain-containing protein [Lachnospiraceae bacterium]|nr:EAL domain-containing protein [Lachnospiraceae bacterium]